MKPFFILLFLFILGPSAGQAQEDAWSYTEDNLHPGKTLPVNPQEIRGILESTTTAEDNDPLEPLNRSIFWINEVIDIFFLERLAAMYNGVVPELVRERVGYVLRNLSEPIVFANNLLQGDIEDAGDTLGRFVVNSTFGLAGIFDVSTDWGLPYKKEDFGMTLASWGVEPGPYLVLPILGPSNVRDTVGRIGDYAFDPINWWAYTTDHELYSNIRTGVQVLDAKADILEILEDLRRNSIDYYASIRSWYFERRKSLTSKAKGLPLESPRPDEDEDEDETNAESQKESKGVFDES